MFAANGFSPRFLFKVKLRGISPTIITCNSETMAMAGSWVSALAVCNALRGIQLDETSLGIVTGARAAADVPDGWRECFEALQNGRRKGWANKCAARAGVCAAGFIEPGYRLSPLKKIARNHLLRGCQLSR